jgi:hypothetical protein
MAAAAAMERHATRRFSADMANWFGVGVSIARGLDTAEVMALPD